MGNWNELIVTPENGEELHLEGGKSAKFGMQDYIDFVYGFIASQVKDKAKCDVFIKDDYSNNSFSIEFEADYTFTCIITGKKFNISSTKKVDFTEESFWDGFFCWDEEESFPITGAFFVSSFYEDDDILFLLDGVPTKNNPNKETKDAIILFYAYTSKNDAIIRIAESGNTELTIQLLKGIQ